MKKIIKLATLSMTATLLLAACGDAGDVDDPGMEDPATEEPAEDPAGDEEMDDELDGDAGDDIDG